MVLSIRHPSITLYSFSHQASCARGGLGWSLRAATHRLKVAPGPPEPRRAGQVGSRCLDRKTCYEKTSIQARIRKHPTEPPGRGPAMLVEHECERGGALAYLAAWDVRQAELFGRLVTQVMEQEPYFLARRVFWVVDTGSSHRGQACVRRLEGAWPNLVVVHLPIHASWLNQIEIYFSIVQRKVLTPNDFPSLEGIEARLLAFQDHYEALARPFEWKFTRNHRCESHTG